MTAPPTTGDSGTASAPSPRAKVFPGGMPASPTTDYANGGTPTLKRDGVFNPPDALFPTNPPSAPSDPGSG